MAIYDRTHKVLALGENSMGTLHNTYTPRGARTRDASFWGEVFYLTGAQELRDPEAKFKGRRLMDNQDVMPYASGSLLFDYLGINFDGEKGFSYQKKLGVELVTDNGSEKYLVSFILVQKALIRNTCNLKTVKMTLHCWKKYKAMW